MLKPQEWEGLRESKLYYKMQEVGEQQGLFLGKAWNLI